MNRCNLPTCICPWPHCADLPLSPQQNQGNCTHGSHICFTQGLGEGRQAGYGRGTHILEHSYTEALVSGLIMQALILEVRKRT